MPFESRTSESEKLLDEVNLTRWTSEEDCHHLRSSTSRRETTFGAVFTESSTKYQVFGALILIALVTYITFNYISLQQYPTENEIMEKLTPAVHHHVLLPTKKVKLSTTLKAQVKKQSSKPKTKTKAVHPKVNIQKISSIQKSLKMTEASTDNETTTVNRVENPIIHPPEAKNMSCHLPHLNPTDPSIQPMISGVPEKPKCPKENYLYDFDYERSLMVRMPLEGHSLWTNCCYKAVFRASNKSDNIERLVRSVIHFIGIQASLQT